MRSAAKWVIPLVRPNLALFWTNLLLAGLWYWSDVWLPTDAADWLGRESGLAKSAVYFAAWIVLWIVALIVVMKIVSPIHYAIDPAYAAERAQRRRVQKLKIGDRVRVADPRGEIRGTITRVIPTGEYFYVTWDEATKQLIRILLWKTSNHVRS